MKRDTAWLAQQAEGDACDQIHHVSIIMRRANQQIQRIVEQLSDRAKLEKSLHEDVVRECRKK